MAYFVVNNDNNHFMSNNRSLPYRHVSETIVPTKTATSLVWGGALCDIENTIYRDKTYTTITITYYTTNSDPGHMSRTTALTRASTSETEYYTRSSTSDTIYYTRASTSGTGYLTRSSTSYTSYGTRVSTSTTGYLTRSSTSDTSYGTRSSTYATEYYTRASTSGTSYGTAEITKPGAYTHIYYEIKTDNYDIYSITNSVFMQVTSTDSTTYYYLDNNTAYSYSLYGSFTSSLTSIYNDMRTTTKINTGVHYNAGSWDMRNIVYNNSDSLWGYTVTNGITSMTNYTNQMFRMSYTKEVNTSQNTYSSIGMYQTLDLNNKEIVTTGTTYLTRSSTSDESYITRASTSGTTYYTRKSTSATTYGTRISTSGTTYYTRKSTSGTTYATRKSTSATSYETRSSTSATSYYTRSSTSAYSGISSSTLTTIN